MAVYAYLRVSTDWRDVQTQRHGILEYANVRNLGSLEFVEDEASGRMNWRERAIDLPHTGVGLGLRSAGLAFGGTPARARSVSA
jgi:Resolvase, N terminal domain